MAIREQYPKDFQEFLTLFKIEGDCWQYLFDMRWPDGFICPRCKNGKYWLTEKGLIHCTVCEHQTSITSGTIFQGTRNPLILWFHIIWWVVAQKTGASAYNLKDFMGFGSYETAWAWLHKLRRAMIRSGRDRLVGEVEVEGNVSPKHLPYYLDEFAFRFNRKMSTFRGKLFYRLIQQAVVTPPVTLYEIVKNELD